MNDVHTTHEYFLVDEFVKSAKKAGDIENAVKALRTALLAYLPTLVGRHHITHEYAGRKTVEDDMVYVEKDVNSIAHLVDSQAIETVAQQVERSHLLLEEGNIALFLFSQQVHMCRFVA